MIYVVDMSDVFVDEDVTARLERETDPKRQAPTLI
jgi:hypothetical protein